MYNTTTAQDRLVDEAQDLRVDDTISSLVETIKELDNRLTSALDKVEELNTQLAELTIERDALALKVDNHS